MMLNRESALISVIIPVFNAEKYLCQAIESVINQSYDNWELILVNDGSADGSADICKRYLQHHDRIRYIEVQNGGVSQARNHGISLSRGEFLFFMDADDILTIDCLQYLKMRMDETGVDVIFGNSLSFNNNKEYKPCSLHSDDIADSKLIINDILSGKVICSIWGKLYRKAAIGDILFKKGLSIGEDINFLIRLFIDNLELKVWRDSHVVYKYRIVGSSISHSKKNAVENVRTYIDAMYEIYSHHMNAIQNTCITVFSKNLIGSIFVYLRSQPLFRKHLEYGYIDIVRTLSQNVMVESYQRPMNIIKNGTQQEINLYFTYDNFKNLYTQYKISVLNRCKRVF